MRATVGRAGPFSPSLPSAPRGEEARSERTRRVAMASRPSQQQPSGPQRKRRAQLLPAQGRRRALQCRRRQRRSASAGSAARTEWVGERCCSGALPHLSIFTHGHTQAPQQML
ncbi:uncharacterized protein LOC128414838 isoform X4 [Podarcis raffonei]|uniref:uncharacterized protein LOC128414838 isoform X4 n=1 Tax=Podarcis raffonei TaxID=65483 RepID=UPI002329925E|nr:uncharacterized protein LOC128414838 isoform X4 [Podarcis raffonei]